jgi:Circularly permutated YpsA SLOG family
MIQKIVSGGQTGADRMALDWAIGHDVPHGGWCPEGRKAADGPLEARYLLTETPSSSYPERTEWNVRDYSDGTVIFSLAPALTGGSKKTAAFAIKHKKPWLHIYRDGQYDAAELLLRFISDHRIKILNVAGPRASKEPQIAAFVKKVLEEAFFSSISGPGER